MTKRLLLLLATVALVAVACGPGAAPEQTTTLAGDGEQPPGQQPGAGSTLEVVQDRGELICGVNEAVPGFGFLTPEGDFEGFDIDYCRAVAAAVLGDANAVNFVPLTAEQRFTALQAGEIDVLIRNTTWTATRDASLGATFATTTFYDGQGMMVPADSEFQTLDDMGNTTICVLTGTTTELNLNSVFEAQGIPFTPLGFESNDTLQEAFIQGRCDGWTSDKSQLAALRSEYPDSEGGPEALRILDVTMSKEPLGPVTRDNDSAWSQVVDWVVIATIQAEEFGITSQNVEQMKGSDNAEIARFLGQEADFDSGLGLDPEWAANVIAAVGNYAEIYDRNVAPVGIPRGVNSLWVDGGLLYPPPYR